MLKMKDHVFVYNLMRPLTRHAIVAKSEFISNYDATSFLIFLNAFFIVF